MQFSCEHWTIDCQMPCDRTLRCGHTCVEQCFVRPCECPCGDERAGRLWPGLPSKDLASIDVFSTSSTPANAGNNLVTLQQSLSLKPKLSPSRSPQRSPPRPSLRANYDMPTPAEAAQLKAYQAYAAGGHKESDKQLDAHARAIIEKQRQKLAHQAKAVGPLSSKTERVFTPKKADAPKKVEGPAGGSGERVKRKGMWIGGLVPKLEETKMTD